MEKVVVTGLGVVSPIGIGVERFFESLKQGKNGISRISLFDPSLHSVQIAGEVKDFNPEDYVDKKDVKRLDRVQQFAFAAAKGAIEDSGLLFEKENTERIGVYVTSGVGGIRSIEDQVKVYYDRGPDRVSPFLITQLIIDAIPAYIAIKYGLKGDTLAAVAACASSGKTIGEAFYAIQRGDLDVVIAGGADAAITPVGVAAFASMRALSKRNDAPEKASRPFDKNRDGFVMGEGASILILESLSHAKSRGAKIYAELAGYGTSVDAYHITAPDPSGKQVERSMLMALQKAGLTVNDVDYINAHGTSTPLNDKNETFAIKEVFGDRAYKIPVSSTKSMVGHLLGASSALESVATVLTINNGIIFPTINYEEADPDCDLDYVPNVAREFNVKVALKNSFGFGGHNITLLYKKFED
ncbi:MAG: beta-ketoacyl-[acyl-carrier-protein] synthase II [Caldiserica bacterium CG23_combo_of_CG06-09_8_20_14_all_35_60]|nr:beta-ketoacyl-ACP synthase II [Caldisericota bacterium]PIP49764.1 MAG: beta-ketoacyl-[acyl-carrier-protein] synthase II [Caldiserica bacterium CG23_combo_of_CG06-09_8_20_14_all_35_60]PIW10581.1 MAG: beta-ketoacyl-[acyl-carrier-protein] synthase II [Caldiserica bacterium CG17_big_fil_post_rev_8_21_14_2_50_35_7]